MKISFIAGLAGVLLMLPITAHTDERLRNPFNNVGETHTLLLEEFLDDQHFLSAPPGLIPAKAAAVGAEILCSPSSPIPIDFPVFNEDSGSEGIDDCTTLVAGIATLALERNLVLAQKRQTNRKISKSIGRMLVSTDLATAVMPDEVRLIERIVRILPDNIDQFDAALARLDALEKEALSRPEKNDIALIAISVARSSITLFPQLQQSIDLQLSPSEGSGDKSGDGDDDVCPPGAAGPIVGGDVLGGILGAIFGFLAGGPPGAAAGAAAGAAVGSIAVASDVCTG